MINDIKCLVLTLAKEDSFSKFSMGGGPEHNLNLVPFLLHGALCTWMEDPDYLQFKPIKSMERYFEDYLKEIPQASHEEDQKMEDLSDEDEQMSESNSETDQKELQTVNH